MRSALSNPPPPCYSTAMSPIRLLAVTTTALAFSSCFNKSANEGYDTSNPYGAPQSGADQGSASAPYQPVNPPANQTYDTPAAYEENSSPSAPTPDTALIDPGVSKPSRPANSRPAPQLPPAKLPASGTDHVVVKGDTLGGIARKYGTTPAAIKQANAMTSDTIVLGKKLKIPAH